jgi:ferric-dicitrate binding protein FerR (iron transport regulator)
MNRCQRWTPALLLMVLVAVQSTTSNAETRSATIGVAASITPSAEGGIGTVFQTLATGSELHANETVRTGDAGKADLVFIDRTNLTVGPTSEVVLDKFVYDPVGSSGKVVLQTTRGAFRFVTGTQDHSAYQINTPYGSLGVRGTTFNCEVKPKGQKQQIAGCDVKCTVESGEIDITSRSGNKRTAKAGQTVCLSGNNISVASAEGPHSIGGPTGGGGPSGGGCVPKHTPHVIDCP